MRVLITLNASHIHIFFLVHLTDVSVQFTYLASAPRHSVSCRTFISLLPTCFLSPHHMVIAVDGARLFNNQPELTGLIRFLFSPFLW